ncbi:hypothetical protein C8R47DRAFT_1212727 [Mycena vitilis]|nr:hypothetical protein C8R47DRAFT_1212727 [Mycena vitilis]
MDISTDHPTTPTDQPPPGSTSTDSSMTAAPQSPPTSSVPLKRPREEDDDGTAHKVQPRAVHTGQAMEKIAALEAENYARKAAMDLNESTVRSLNAKLEEVHGHCTRWELLVQQLTTELADCSTVPEHNTELERRLEEANAQIDLLHTESEDLSDQVADLIGDLKKSEQELEIARSLIQIVEEEKRKISKHNDDLTAAAVAHQDALERIRKLDEELLNTQRGFESMQTNYNTLRSDMDAKIEDAVKIQVVERLQQEYNEMKRTLQQRSEKAEKERQDRVAELTNMSDTFKASLEARIRELEAENTQYKSGEERHRWAENFVKVLSKDNASLKAALATANANLQRVSAFHQNQAKAPGSEDIPMPDAGLNRNGPSLPSSTFHQPSMGQPTSSPSAHQQTGPTSSSTAQSTDLPASRPSDRDIHMVDVEPAPSNPQQSGSSSAPRQSTPSSAPQHSSSSAPQQSTSSASQRSGSSNPQQSGSTPQQDVPTTHTAPPPNTPPNTPPNNTSAGTSQFRRGARSTAKRPDVVSRRTPRDPRPDNERKATACFRKFIKLRLQIKNDKDVRSLKLVTIEHAAASEPGKNDEPLALVMDDTTTNDWNHSVGVILIEAFRLEHEDTTISDEFLTEQWGKRLAELKRNYKALANLDGEEETALLAAKAAGARRTTHRTQVLTRRNKAWQFSDLAEEVKVHFAAFFEAMSGQCMSSDEEDDPPSRTKVVRVLRKDWRASDLISLLKWLDYYYHHSLLNSHGVKQGGGTRSRIRSAPPGKASDRPVISGLPSNFYNSVWLAQQSAAQLQALKVLPPVELPVYVLTWPTNLMFKGDPDDHDEYWKPPTEAL